MLKLFVSRNLAEGDFCFGNLLILLNESEYQYFSK